MGCIDDCMICLLLLLMLLPSTVYRVSPACLIDTEFVNSYSSRILHPPVQDVFPMDVLRPGGEFICGVASSSISSSSSIVNPDARDGGGADGPNRLRLTGVTSVECPGRKSSESLYPMLPSRCSAVLPRVPALPSGPVGRDGEGVDISGRGIGVLDTGDRIEFLLPMPRATELPRELPRLLPGDDVGTGPKPGDPGGRLFGSHARRWRICCFAAAFTLDPPRPNPINAMSAPRHPVLRGGV